jgi:hypothetical protein
MPGRALTIVALLSLMFAVSGSELFSLPGVNLM